MKQIALRALIQGSIVVLPLLVTIWLIWSALVWLDDLGASALEIFGFEELFPGMGFILMMIALLAVGMLVQVNMVNWLYRRLENMLLRFPLVKTLYGAVKDFAAMFDREKKPHSQQVVLVNMGSMGHLVGFITSASLPSAVQPEYAGKDIVSVYLPMSYMVGGYTLFIPRKQLTPVDWSFEDAMRFALTAGISQSEAHTSKDEPSQNP